MHQPPDALVHDAAQRGQIIVDNAAVGQCAGGDEHVVDAIESRKNVLRSCFRGDVGRYRAHIAQGLLGLRQLVFGTAGNGDVGTVLPGQGRRCQPDTAAPAYNHYLGTVECHGHFLLW
jgi:hypothetical protein